MTFWLCSDLGCFSFDLDFDRFCFLLDVLLVRLPAVAAAATDLTFRFGMVETEFCGFWLARWRWRWRWHCGRWQDANVTLFSIRRFKFPSNFQSARAFASLLKRSNPTRSLAFNPIFLSSQIQTRAQSKSLPNAIKINRLFVSNQRPSKSNQSSRPSLNPK